METGSKSTAPFLDPTLGGLGSVMTPGYPVPLVALGISTVYEGYHWSAHNLIGMELVLIGNGLVINKKALVR